MHIITDDELGVPVTHAALVECASLAHLVTDAARLTARLTAPAWLPPRAKDAIAYLIDAATDVHINMRLRILHNTFSTVHPDSVGEGAYVILDELRGAMIRHELQPAQLRAGARCFDAYMSSYLTKYDQAPCGEAARLVWIARVVAPRLHTACAQDAEYWRMRTPVQHMPAQSAQSAAAPHDAPADVVPLTTTNP